MYTFQYQRVLGVAKHSLCVVHKLVIGGVGVCWITVAVWCINVYGAPIWTCAAPGTNLVGQLVYPFLVGGPQVLKNDDW